MERAAKTEFGMRISEDLIRFFSIQALLSNLPLEKVRNNLNGIFDDSSRVDLQVDNVEMVARCFNRLQSIRKDHVNNHELMGLLMSPILTYHYDLLSRIQRERPSPRNRGKSHESEKPSGVRKSSLTQFPDINRPSHVPGNLCRLGKFIHKFRIRFPVFRRFFVSQGVGSALTVRPVPVDHALCTQNLLFADDFANDAFFMSLFYFVTLFAKNDPRLDEGYLQDFLFEFFIKNR